MTERHRDIEGIRDSEQERVQHMIDVMARNRAYVAAVARAGGDPDGSILRDFQNRYRRYRADWRGFPDRAIREALVGGAFVESGQPPLCVDLEVAAVCDLACPHCYRQSTVTPDKIMAPEFAFDLIDQVAAMGVPSIKFNWRGEPLLHPRLPEFIAYAKDKGVLETIINTNATELDEKMAEALIRSGLDLVIYSFDGGTKPTYERLRPGRFRENQFETVLDNIRRFAEIRRRLGSAAPRTKIQMVLTAETFVERDAFFALFKDWVDDVSTVQYTERGAGLADLDHATKDKVAGALEDLGLPEDTPYMRRLDGELHVAAGRLPCEQPFQRLMITYDGRVGMCCYDWGAQHPIGFTNALALTEEPALRRILDRINAGELGFSMMAGATLPRTYNEPEARVQTLKEIWSGAEVDKVRRAQVQGRPEAIEICAECPFKETYQWKKIG